MRVDDFADLSANLRHHAQSRRPNGAFVGRPRGFDDEPESGTPWPELQELPSAADPEPAGFPTRGLGPILGPATEALAETVQVPPALAAGSVLATAAVAAQRLVDVEGPNDTVVPASLFFISVAGSGDRKSAVDAEALVPVDEFRRREVRDFEAKRRAYESERAALRNGDPTPKPPTSRSLTISKATVEGLQQVLRGQPTIGLLTSEGAEVLGGYSMREERRTAGIAWLLKAWSGETLDSLTRGDGLSVLIGRRVTMHLMLQPVIAESLLTDSAAHGQGFIARCLIAAPRSIAGSRFFRDDAIPARRRPEVQAFHDRIRQLLACEPRPNPDGDGVELARRIVRLSPEACALWAEFYNEVEGEQAPGGRLCHERVKPWASKAAEHARRLAAVIEIASSPEAVEISGPTMEGAIEVAVHYLAEFLRLLGLSSAALNARQLAQLANFMRDRGPSVSHANVLQSVPRELRSLKAEGLNKLLDELARLGHIRRRGDSWEVRP